MCPTCDWGVREKARRRAEREDVENKEGKWRERRGLGVQRIDDWSEKYLEGDVLRDDEVGKLGLEVPDE